MIQKLAPEYIDQTVALHREVLGHTLNARIGPWFLRRLYKLVMCGSTSQCRIVIEGEKVVGFISFCSNRSLTERSIMNDLHLVDKIRVLAFLSMRPWLWPLLVRQLLFGRHLKQCFTEPYASILTLGVSAKLQGRGVGGSLVDEAIRCTRDAGSEVLFVDTEATNTNAVAFYLKSGFQQVADVHGNIILKFQHHGYTGN